MAVLGRPRDPEVNGAAMAAAIELIVETGYPGLTMDRIAERAAVSKAALYRRWPNKQSLVADAVGDYARTAVGIPDTGSVRGDMAGLLRSFAQGREADAERWDGLSDALRSDPELGCRCRNLLADRFAAAFRTIVERGVAREELPAGSDVELLAELVPAMVRYHREATGRRLEDRYVERLLQQFFPRP